MKKIDAYFRLVRPANLITAVADVLAGVAIAGRFESGFEKTWVHILLLCLSTAFLYAGGIVYNDVFDADTDEVDHPERPIPGGDITVGRAKQFGFILLVLGIVAGGLGSDFGGFIALGITFFALIYDKWGKHNFILGPLNSGICRGLNLIMGLSMVPFALHDWYLLALVPIIYIYALILISRGQLQGRNRQNLKIGAFLYAVVVAAILYQSDANSELELTGLFLIAFILMLYIPLSKAISYPMGTAVRKAVKSGIFAIILMDAAWAATFNSLIAAIIIVLLLPVTTYLSKYFPVA